MIGPYHRPSRRASGSDRAQGPRRLQPRGGVRTCAVWSLGVAWDPAWSKPMTNVDLSVVVNGMVFENPFVLGSGPPGTNARVIAKSYDLGWGGMVIKTIS